MIARSIRGVTTAWSLAAAAAVTAVATVVILVPVAAASRLGARGTARGWGRQWVRLVLWAFGVSYTVRGRRLPEGGCVLVANHRSRWEGLCLFLAFDGAIDIAVSRRMASVPVMGQAMLALGFIPVRRTRPVSAARRLVLAAPSLRGGRRLLVFPEGRRPRRPGLLPFKPGAFRLAVEAGVPLIPVAVADGRITGRAGGALELSVGEPIPTRAAGRDAVPALVCRCRAAISEMLEDAGRRSRSSFSPSAPSRSPARPCGRRARPDPAGG